MKRKKVYPLEKRRFFGHWRWVHIRICPECKEEVRLLGVDTRLKPQLGKGAIYCPHCEKGLISLG